MIPFRILYLPVYIFLATVYSSDKGKENEEIIFGECISCSYKESKRIYIKKKEEKQKKWQEHRFDKQELRCRFQDF